VGETPKVRADVQAAAVAKRPVGEQRSSIVPELSSVNVRLPGWSHFMPAEREQTPAWLGRQRIETVQTMLNDSQVTSLRQAIRLPAHRYRIALDPGDCDEATTDLLATDLDVPLVDAPDETRPGRRANRFSARRHLDRALDALDYGHAVFEQAGRIDAEGLWRLVDLAPVPQWTIDDPTSWEIDRRGRLIQVVQRETSPPIELPVDHLVVHTWQGAPGDPRGRSMLRPLYGPWLLRDRTLRIMGMSDQRTGMGIPIGKVPTGSSDGVKAKLEQLLAGLAAGQDTNLVIESDDSIRDAIMLMGVTGSTPDLVGHLRYYDESMARAMLAMLLQLGQTETGSRALGGTFDDLLAMFHDAVMDWYCDVMTQQLCEPWIDRNRGLEAPAPRLVNERREVDSTAEEIDATAEEDAPAQLPAPATARRRNPAGAGLARRQNASRAAFAAVAGRELRREPTAAELAAGTDFAQLETQYVAVRAPLTAALLRARDELAGVAVDAIRDMGTVDPLTLGATLGPRLTEHASGMDTEPLVTLLATAAANGCTQIIGEAARQGITIDATVDYTDRAEAEALEMLRRVAVQVTESSTSAARTRVPATASRRGLLSRVFPAMFAGGEADAIAAHLASLTPANPEQSAGGATSRATNAGRAAAIDQSEPTSIYGSEILDENTCSPCRTVDGRVYETLEEALNDYPGGGYVGCDGMERCRGTLVAVYEGDV
jgi:hypothetical protein